MLTVDDGVPNSDAHTPENSVSVCPQKAIQTYIACRNLTACGSLEGKG